MRRMLAGLFAVTGLLVYAAAVLAIAAVVAVIVAALK